MIAKNATNAHVSSLYCSTRLYFCFSDIITAPERRIAYRPLLWSSGCPNNVAIICHLPHGVLCRPPSGYSLSSSLLVGSTIGVLGLCISCLDCSFVFVTILSGCGSKNRCYIDIAHMHDGVGIRSTLASTDPMVATYLIQCYYNSRERMVLPFFICLSTATRCRPCRPSPGSLSTPCV
jgi:hypothetical protein